MGVGFDHTGTNKVIGKTLHQYFVNQGASELMICNIHLLYNSLNVFLNKFIYIYIIQLPF